MTTLYPTLQHIYHYYVDMDVYIYTSPLKYPHLTVQKQGQILAQHLLEFLTMYVPWF